MILDELIRELAEEFKTARRPVARVDNPLEEKVGVDANDAEDAEVEPLGPILGAKIVVHPQLIRTDPVVPVNCASALVICRDGPRLGDMDDDHVWVRQLVPVELVQSLAIDLLSLSDTARRHYKITTIAVEPAHCDEFRFAGLLADGREDQSQSS